MPVELFSISCTTCRARLKVHSRDVIGQIVTCPKCESMVQVSPPPGWNDPSGSPAPSAGPMPIHKTPTAAVDKTPPPLPRGMAAARQLIPPRLPTKLERSLLLTHGHASPLPRGRVAEDWLAVASAGLGGVILGLGIWIFAVSQGRHEQVAERHRDIPPGTWQHPADPSAHGDGWQSPQAPTTGKEPGEFSTGVPAPATTQTPAPQTSQPVPPSAIAATTKQEVRPPAATQPTPNSPQVAASATAPAQKPDQPAPAPFTVVAPQALVVDSTVAKAAPAATSTPSAHLSAPPVPINIRARLKDKVATIDFREMPLAQFKGFMAELSTIPIELDQAGLKRAGRSEATLVTVRMSNTTVAKVIAKALEPHGLTLRIEPTKAVITAAN